MSEARVREKELSSPQEHRIFPRFEGVMCGPKMHKFKRNLHFDRGKRMFPPFLVQIRSRFWSCQIFGMSAEGISTISTVYSAAGKFLQGLPHFRLSAPFL